MNLTFNINTLTINYIKEYDGGGTWFGQEYIEIIKQRYPNRYFNRCYEWCSGPGFIGLSILDNNLCDSLCLSDMYAPALECATNTVKNTPYESKVSTYLTSTLAGLNQSEKFDLVVGNPPHYIEYISDNTNQTRMCRDDNWETHLDFFKHIKSHLADDGIILLQENQKGSTVKTFESMIDQADLVVTDTFNSHHWFDLKHGTQIYYIEIKHKIN
jgi:methylase of polypeptide subunit release factors